MRLLVKIDQMLLRLLIVVMLVIGVLVWMGHTGLTNAHIGLGFIFTMAVLLQALLGAVGGAGWGLSGLTVLWAVLLPVIGLGQRAFMVGDAHWVVRVVHMLFGLATMAFVERIAKRVLSKAPAAG